MNDITAAIGIEQLKKLPEFVGRRATLTAMYESRLKPLPKAGRSSCYFFWVQTDQRDRLAQYLKENGVYTTFRYYPLHWAMGVACNLPNTEWVADHTLLLPLHQGMDYHDIDYICELIERFQNDHK
jgi:aminotransferase